MSADSTAIIRQRTGLARWWAAACLLVAGCAGVPRIDPTGERLLVWPSPAPPPGVPAGTFPPPPGTPPLPGSLPVVAPMPPAQWGLSVSPTQTIAPVGSEVVLIASVSGNEGFLLNNERIEWMLAPDGVGQFLSPGQRGPLEVFHWLHGLPKKVDSRYVVNTTLQSTMVLDRGTPTPFDDITVRSGQAWVSLTSATEGTSNVTVFAPQVGGWDRRQQNVTIYWVDAQWRFPAPAITAGGSAQLITALTRQSDGSPLTGWPVRYEIANGPEAGFAPDGGTSIEVLTNAVGEAPVELVQKQPVAGTNQVQIYILRPPTIGGANRAVPVGSGSTLQTWTVGAGAGPIVTPTPAQPLNPVPAQPSQPAAPATPPAAAAAQLDVSIYGPTTATVGSSARFEIQVVNRGTGVARNVMVNDRFGAGLQHPASASPIEHPLVDLPPGATGRLIVNFQVIQAGESCQDVTVTADGGLSANTRNCLTAVEPPTQQPQEPAQEPPATTPSPAGAAPLPTAAAQLTVNMTGPDRQQVGGTARFKIQITNTSDKPVTNLEIADHFETSLQPTQATEGYTWLEGSTLGWKVASLDPGKTIENDIEFRCLRPTPKACNRVTVKADGIDSTAGQECLEITAEPGAAAPAEPAKLNVTVADTADPIKVGGEVTYQILLSNEGTQSAFDVGVNISYGEELQLEGMNGPVNASVLASGVRFEPIRELRAGENALSYELKFKGAKAGTARVHVDTTARGATKPTTAEQTTQVLPAN